MKKVCKKILSIFAIILILLNNCCQGKSLATEISSANLNAVGKISYHLKYYNESVGDYTYIICTVVGYNHNNNFYPAYCINSDLPGITSDTNYSVNVNSLIERDDIWRVVTNGYPYKTPEQMGVSDCFNAFAVTKFAVYCMLGQSDINKFYADPGDSEANAMLNSLRNLVNIGRFGGESKSGANISIVNEGGLKDEGSNFSQIYKVNSNVDMNSYEITNTENLPEGAQIVKQDENHLKLIIPKNKMNNDINIGIKLKGQCKVYPIFYGETSVPGTQNYILTYDSFGELEGNARINFKTNNGKIRVYKTDDEKKIPIPNVKFELYKDNNLICSKETDSKGIIEFDNLYQGNYIIKEVKTGDEYVLSEEPIEVWVNYGKVTELEIGNKLKKGSLEIYKFDKEQNIPLEGVEFELYNSKDELIDIYTTDMEGKIFVDNLKEDENYYVIETKTMDAYELNNKPIYFNIKYNETTKLEVENDLKKARIKIIKVDKEDKTKKIEGVKFELYDENSNLIETLVTDQNGEAYSKLLPCINRIYSLVEIEAPKGYVIDKDYKIIKFTSQEDIELVIENEIEKPEEEKVEQEEYSQVEIKVLPRTGF